MSSFFFERQEIHCSCFDSSPKNIPKLFRTDSKHQTPNQKKLNKQQSVRNNSQQEKTKKKSLKKERNSSLTVSQKDHKQKQDSAFNIHMPDIQPIFSAPQHKKQQRITVLSSYEQPSISQIKSQRNRPSHRIYSQRPHALYEPLYFQPNYKIQNPPISVQIHSEKNIIDDFLYDQKITRQFEKDFKQFKLQMDMIDSKPQGKKNKKTQKEFNSTTNKQIIQSNPFQERQQRIRYPVTDHIIRIPEKSSPQKANSFRNSQVKTRQKILVKPVKNQMFPKQIESEKGSSDGQSSGKESVFLGRGLDGLTEKPHSFIQSDQNERNNLKTHVETMVTQQSNIKNSQINTLTQYSHNLTSPKSQQNLRMAFGGNKYDITGNFFHNVGEMKEQKLSSLRKFYL